MVLLAGRLRGTQRKMPTHLLFLFGRIAERLKRLPFQLNSSQVVFRFALRLALLSIFATFGTQRFREDICRPFGALSHFLCRHGHHAAERAVRSGADPLGRGGGLRHHWSSGFCALLTNLSASQRSL